jgi:Ca2+-binding EF-hand superfamily protein
MNMQKTMTVIVASVFSLSAAGVGMAASAGSEAGARDGKDKLQMASYGHHGRGHGKKARHGDRHGARGLDRLLEAFDANDDGDLTQDEIIDTRKAQLSKFDANGDGVLDISEYEALWLDAMRERMVDRFQAHDDDGDGSVTIEEYTEEFVNLVKRRDRNDDGVLNADDVKRPSKKGQGPEDR